MNKTYRVIWNHSLRCFVAVSELCKNKKKSASIVVVAALLSSLTFSMNVQAQITDENSLDDEELQLLQTQLKHVSERIRSMASEPALDIESSSSVPSIMEVTNIGRSIDPNNTVNIIVKGDTPASVRMDINVWGSGIKSEHRTDGLGVSALKQDNAYQIAIGNGSYSGIGGTTLGSGASSGTGAVAVGPYVNAAGRASVGIGAGAYSGDNAVGIGSWSAATGNRSNALGSLSGATGQDSTAIGTSSMASGIRSIAFGSTSNVGSEADPLQDTVSNTNASGVDSIAIGTNAKSIADGAIAFGLNSEASVANGLAIGANAVASAVNSVALGADSIADRINSVSIGKSGATRQLVNVSAGTADQDATNVAQIKPIISALGGGATIDPTTGEVSGPQYTLTKINPITGSSQAVSTAFTSVGDALSNLNSSISNLSNSALRYVDATSKSMIMLGGDDGTTITNLKPGEVGVSSSDAVNGSQLFATNTAVAANGASIALNTSGLKAT
ncbi:ESPR-type extended signal peptide-containing protein, partial [Hafnia paralvei]